MNHKYMMFRREVSVLSENEWVRQEITDGPIRIMAEAEGYALVRRKGCIPFVIQSKDIIREEPTK